MNETQTEAQAACTATERRGGGGADEATRASTIVTDGFGHATDLLHVGARARAWRLASTRHHTRHPPGTESARAHEGEEAGDSGAYMPLAPPNRGPGGTRVSCLLWPMVCSFVQQLLHALFWQRDGCAFCPVAYTENQTDLFSFWHQSRITCITCREPFGVQWLMASLDGERWKV